MIKLLYMILDNQNSHLMDAPYILLKKKCFPYGIISNYVKQSKKLIMNVTKYSSVLIQWTLKHKKM